MLGSRQHQKLATDEGEVFNINILLHCVSLHSMMWYIINLMYVCKGIRPLEMAKWRQNLLVRPHAVKNWNLWKSIIQYSSDWTTYTHQYKQINEISTKHVCLWIRVIRFQFLCHLKWNMICWRGSKRCLSYIVFSLHLQTLPFSCAYVEILFQFIDLTYWR